MSHTVIMQCGPLWEQDLRPQTMGLAPHLTSTPSFPGKLPVQVSGHVKWDQPCNSLRYTKGLSSGQPTAPSDHLSALLVRLQGAGAACLWPLGLQELLLGRRQLLLVHPFCSWDTSGACLCLSAPPVVEENEIQPNKRLPVGSDPAKRRDSCQQ